MAQPTTSNNKSNIAKKSVSMDDEYQSTFLPIFTDAEKRIKELIVIAFIIGMSRVVLAAKISKIIREVKKKLPQDLHDRDVYLKGLTKTAEYLIRVKELESTKFRANAKKNGVLNSKGKIAQSPKEMKKPNDVSARGTPQIEWYNKELDKYIDEISQEPVTTSESDKKPISLWQKAEIDVRQQHNQKMLQDLKDNGVKYAYLSSHANCSKRCEKWQGRLVSLDEHATMSGFRVRKIDGKWAYSLTDIMAQKDKYGYNNNIISGFNCRHYLIPYEIGSDRVPPKTQNAKEVEKQRETEKKIRAMERQIRYYRMKLVLYNSSNDNSPDTKSKIQKLKKAIKLMTKEYQTFCTTHGYAWYEYRIKV